MQRGGIRRSMLSHNVETFIIMGERAAFDEYLIMMHPEVMNVRTYET